MSNTGVRTQDPEGRKLAPEPPQDTSLDKLNPKKKLILELLACMDEGDGLSVPELEKLMTKINRLIVERVITELKNADDDRWTNSWIQDRIKELTSGGKR